MANMDWPYPGSRWWKFDFHTHTPASKDTSAWQRAIGTDDEITPDKWLLKYMAAEIDCVAITDHNSGAWVDKLKSAYAAMEELDEMELAPEGFRKLTLYPGVEISTHGGIHVIAIFNPDATSSDIDSLLGKVDYSGTKGDSDSVTSKGIAEVMQAILSVGAVPIPAHADREKGLLQCQPDSKKSQVDAHTLRQALSVEGLLALEWCDNSSAWPECVGPHESRLARVQGSDCHNFQGNNVPGSRYTWVKMASPTLEGLRLALLDGNDISVRRGDDTNGFAPFYKPEHLIKAIEIESAQYIGNGRVARLECSPFFNAIVGGRGTGKSTVVQALRLAARREQELTQLGNDNEPRVQFDAFCKVSGGREAKGALRANTEIRVEWLQEDRHLRLCWRSGDQGVDVEEWDGDQWHASHSQSINHSRFPVRIFSQGQIASMAGSGRQTLLAIIDEAAGIESLQQAFEDARRVFFTQRASLRELDGKLAAEPEVNRKLEEIRKKLATLSRTDQAAVLRAYSQAKHQEEEVRTLFEQLQEDANSIEELAGKIVPGVWSGEAFSEQDAGILALRKDIDAQIAEIRTNLLEKAQKFRGLIETSQQDVRYTQWRSQLQEAQQAHDKLQKQLAEQGVSDPQAFARLTEEKQKLEAQCKAFERMKADRAALDQKIKAQRKLIFERRQAITQSRQAFVQQALANNDHVRITVVPFGYDPRQTERELRELIGVTDDRFADDILNEDASEGLAFEFSRSSESEKMVALKALKKKILDLEGLRGHFRNYLIRNHEKPEFSDHILAWAPEDDLRIQYKRGNSWSDIQTGSQGQRSAALLAFLLAFGEEPIVLDQPEDDLDNHLIYDLIVQQIRENKQRRQLIIVTHNPNVVVNGDADLVHVMEFGKGQCFVQQSGALQESELRKEVCRVMEGGHDAFSRRWKRLGVEI